MWISKEKYEDIERRVKELNEELQRLYNLAYLVEYKTERNEKGHDLLPMQIKCSQLRLFGLPAARIYQN